VNIPDPAYTESAKQTEENMSTIKLTMVHV